MAGTQFEIDNSLMAGLAYQSSRDRINWFPAPSGWVEFSHVPNSTYPTTLGFEASAFQNTAIGHIVISYAGTNPTSLTDWFANLTLGTGFSSSQLEQAALYYLQIKQANPTATISFTGHSLGGGLAALMAVFFDEQAVTYDQAPFESSSSSGIRDNLESFLNSNGYSDSLLTTLVPEFMSYGGYGTRTANVTGYYVEGEALHLPPFSALNTIGTQIPLSQSGAGLDILGIDLHSQTLLTAFLLNTTFRDLTYKLPSLLDALFDEGLYAESTEPGPGAQRNFLDNLLRHQIGVAADPIAGVAAIPADAMLDRFVVDLQKLTPDTYGMAASTDMAKALTVTAMEYHYFKSSGATQLFTFDTFGLHFKYSDIGASSYKSLPKLVDAVNAYLTPEEQAALNGRLAKQDAWHIQSGTGGMIVHAGAGNDVAFGGTNSDGLWGGAGIDILIGGANNDVLAGEAGNDYLLGGIGFDSYIINAGDGTDTLLDTDGTGVVRIAGTDAKGSATAGLAGTDWKHTAGSATWIDRKNNIVYSQSLVSGETRLLVRQGDATVLIRGWSEGELGIVLGTDVSTPPPSANKTYTGTTATNLMMNWDLAGWGWDGSRDYAIPGSVNRYQGLGGSDFFNTDFVDDVIEGGDGNDYALAQYGGADELYGGTGNDYLHIGDPDPANDGGASSASRIPLNNRSYADGGDGNDTLTVARHYAPIAIALDGPSAGLAYSLSEVAGLGSDFETVWSSAYSGWQRAPATFHTLPDTPAFSFTGWQRDGVALAQASDGRLNLYATFQMSVPEFSAYFDAQLTRFAPTLIYDPAFDNDDQTGHVLYGGAGNDMVEGGLGDDFIDGGADNDALDGEQGNDTVMGGAGNDLILGGEGNDWLMGGTGTDELYGESGNDTYVFAKGDGIDRISDHDTTADNVDVVVFQDVAANEVTALNRYGNDLAISYGASDRLTLANYFNAADRIESIQFSDGETWDLNAVNGRVVNNISGTAGNDVLVGGQGSDRLDGGAGADTLIGGAGDDTYIVDHTGDAITELAGEGNDFVSSTVSRTLETHVEGLALDGTANLDATGNALDNSLYGNQGANTLAGGAGNDFLMGGAGNDTYVFNRGDGQDSIDDLDGLGATNTLRFGAGIADTDVVGYRVGDDMVLKLKGSSEQVAFLGYYGADTVDNGVVSNRRIDRVEFANGVVWDQAMIQTVVDRAASNHAPVLNAAVPALQAYADDAFSYVVPADAIVDPDAGDSIVYRVSMPDGSPVPAWLAFDAATRTLSGTPAASDIGSQQFVLWGTDDYGMAIGQYVTLGVSMPNHAPTLSVPLPDQAVSLGSVFNFTVAPGAFTDPDAGDVLAYSAVLTNGNALPAWLHFDAATRTFSGTPSSQGTYSVRVTAKDTGNLVASDAFDLFVSAPDMVLNGTTGPDYLTGNSGNDTFEGGPGNDTLQGGLGNDVYLFGPGDGQDTILEMGGSTDVLRFKAGIFPQQINLVRNDWTVSGEEGLNLILLDAAGVQTGEFVFIRAYFNDDNDARRVDRIEFADGTVWSYADIQQRMQPVASNLSDTLIGFAGSDEIDGLGGDDYLYGRAGNDILHGGEGKDLILGQAGNDSLYGDNGDDDVQGGLGNDTLEGGDGNDRLLGYDVGNANETGNDILHGGLGNDRLFGGQGNDTYLFSRGDGFDLVGDAINSNGTSSTDILRLGAGILPAHVTLHRVNTNDLLVAIDGSNQQIVLSNYFFVDYLGGTDWSIERIEFDGGAGIAWTAADIAARVEAGTQNSMTGTASNDTFVVDHELDTITESANAGIDTVLASRTYTLPGNVENLTLTGFLNINGTGNALDNILRGNNGDNVLTGNGGNDVAYGGLGNDTYKGVTPVELVGEGNDTYLGLGVGTLPDNIEIWDLNDGSGSRPNFYYSVRGNALDNVLISDGFGFGAAIQPNGRLSGDILDGGVGADTVIIRGGDKPIVYIDNPGDRIVGGAYEVRSTVDYSLADNWSKGLALLGNIAINGTGNAIDNTLDGSQNAAVNVLTGGEGNDTYLIGLNDRVVENPGEGYDIVKLTTTSLDDGRDIYLADIGAANVERFTLAGYGKNLALYGDGQDNELRIEVFLSLGNPTYSKGATLHGGAGNDLLYGGDGEDMLDGGAGADQMTGGMGSDIYIVDDVGDLVIDSGDYYFSGYYYSGGARDEVRSSISYTLPNLVEMLTLTGSAATNAFGNGLDNVLTGNSANNTLTGGAGNDYLTGGAGNDLLDGGVGTDTLIGGLGNDYYYVDNAGDVVTELVDEGSDTVESTISYTLGANVEGLQLAYEAGAIDGTGNADNNYLYGNESTNVLTGLAGNDTLWGYEGADTLMGGVGDDLYFIDDEGDLVVENAGEGTDSVYAWGSNAYTLAANVENGYRTFYGGGLTGNDLDNTLIGSWSIDTLDGGLGNDTLKGGSGSDMLVGGSGNDLIEGGAANAPFSTTLSSLKVYARGTPVLGDYPVMRVYVDGVLIQEFVVDATSYTAYVVDMSGLGITQGKIDVVFANDAYRPDIGQDRNLYVQMIEADGRTINAADNGVYYDIGNAAQAFDGINLRIGQEGLATNGALRFYLGDNDTLDGGLGVDQMSGGNGNDTYVVDNAGDVATESADGGTDTVRSSISHTLGTNLENLTLTGSAAINGSGNVLNNLLIGNGGNNSLYGDAGVDTLLGYAGNDRLDGGVGSDLMYGGQGNDTFVVESTGDSVSENANEGWDTVESSINYTLGANVENLSLTGSAAINGTGNALDNSLTGNAANNVLTGGAGNDVLDGGVGADVMAGGTGDDDYIIDNASDVVTENAGEGTSDSVELYLNADYIVGADIEHAYRYGAGNWTTTGNASDNYLYGNIDRDTLVGLAGNDVLYGDAGADTLIGGVGDDRYYVDSAGDIVTENINEGVDTVYVFGTGSLAYTLAANVENGYSPFWAVSFMGNALDNTLSGSYGSDTLDGGLGADTLKGWGGNDIYIVDNVGDVVSETSTVAIEIDTVQSSVTYTLGANLENLTLTGAESLEGTGNALANVLRGNGSSSVLYGLDGNDTLYASDGDEAYGGTGNDNLLAQNTLAWTFLSGEDGDDVLTGGVGSGSFIGGLGNDTITGGAGYNYLWGDESYGGTTGGNDLIQGGASIDYAWGGYGNDTLSGNDGDDTLLGQQGDDQIYGGAGNDVLNGGMGIDTLAGGTGNDTYRLGRDYAADTVVENDTTAGNSDIAQFLSGVTADQIWFRHVGNSLETSIIGTGDKLVIQDWYLGSAYHVEQFKTTDGAKTLLDSNVENLVNAMASFAPPAAGQTSLPQNYQDALAGVIAANWQ